MITLITAATALATMSGFTAGPAFVWEARIASPFIKGVRIVRARPRLALAGKSAGPPRAPEAGRLAPVAVPAARRWCGWPHHDGSAGRRRGARWNRRRTPEPNRRRKADLITALTLATVLATALATVLAAPPPGVPGVPVDVAAVAGPACFVGAGVVAWRSRPRNRMGPLLVAAGLAWVPHQVQLPLPQEVAALVSAPWPAVMAHLAVAFPTGRLCGTWARVVTGAAYACAAVMGARRLAGAEAGAAIGTAGTYAMVAIGLAIIALQVGRLRGSSVTRRRALVPVVGAAVVATAVFIALKPPLIAGVSAPLLSLGVQLALAAMPLAYLAVLLRRRMDKGGVAGLVVRLTGEPPPAALQAALAEALHDPGLRVGYWVGESGRYVDADGRPVAPAPGQVLSRIDRDGPLAVLVHDPVLLEDPELIEAVCAAAGLALANERLMAELRARLRQLGDSRAQVLRAAEAERRRLERDLHDGVQQRLLSIPLTLSLAEAALESGPDRARPLIAEARSVALAVLEEVRALAQGIHPPILTERGLLAAVRELAAVVPVPVTIAAEGLDGAPPLERLPAEIETAAYYVVAEGLANLAKHAGAGSAEVGLVLSGGRLLVTVGDDGQGGADPAAGTGLRGLAARVEAAGGTFRVDSPAGGGTRIEAVLPCE
ncbi:hypothetical protein GCM10023259_056130 [Thermocatellispora tengchongensis]